ncbi:hypothetical protein BDW62DRAFT_211229 [Aspergillus aurantiobrunneus]
MPEPVHSTINEALPGSQTIAGPVQQEDAAACKTKEAELQNRISQLETDLTNAPSADSIRALERSLQAESTAKERAQQELTQKNHELDILRKRWKQAARELDKAKSQSQGFYQVTDNYLVEMATQLRYNIRNFTILYFGGDVGGTGSGSGVEKSKAWKTYMESTTPDPADFERFLASERRGCVVQACIWRFLVGQVFDRFRWAGENGVSLRNMCLFLRPDGQYPDSVDPIVPEEERKFQIWLASTTAIVLDVGGMRRSKRFAAQVEAAVQGLVDKIREVIDPFVTLKDQGYEQELTRIVEEAVNFDREISRQVARVEWEFPAPGKEVVFNPELMRLRTGETIKKDKEKKLVRLVLCPAMKKRGKSTGEDFAGPPTLLVPMEVSCE